MLVLEGYGTLIRRRGRKTPPVSLPVSFLKEKAKKRARETRIYQPDCQRSCVDNYNKCLTSCRA